MAHNLRVAIPNGLKTWTSSTQAALARRVLQSMLGAIEQNGRHKTKVNSHVLRRSPNSTYSGVKYIRSILIFLVFFESLSLNNFTKAGLN